tara:strand:+ start:64912 stop:65235 length:324 start_codon:yes stop_codon:yes gene_type:complete
MQNEATFHIIGRIGSVDIREKVAFISVAANRNYEKDGEWKAQTHWNNVSVFRKDLRERLEKANKGDLVRITGVLYQNNREVDGTTVYETNVVGERFAILAPKSGSEE